MKTSMVLAIINGIVLISWNVPDMGTSTKFVGDMLIAAMFFVLLLHIYLKNDNNDAKEK